MLWRLHCLFCADFRSPSLLHQSFEQTNSKQLLWVSVSCPIMSEPLQPHGLSPPDSAVHGIIPVRILERVAIVIVDLQRKTIMCFISTGIFLDWVLLELLCKSTNWIFCWVSMERMVFLAFFWLHSAVCRILVPWLGIEPGAVSVKTPNSNHCTDSEVLKSLYSLHLVGNNTIFWVKLNYFQFFSNSDNSVAWSWISNSLSSSYFPFFYHSIFKHLMVQGAHY